MSISNNYIPEKINDFNTYMDGNKMIGVAASVTLPEVKMKTSTVSGAGINGEIDSPTIGQFEGMEQEIDFNVLYSSAMDMLSPLVRGEPDAARRPAGLRQDRRLRLQGPACGGDGPREDLQPRQGGEGRRHGGQVTLELTYLLVENDGSPLLEVDKLNGVYKVNGVDMLAGISELT